MRIKEIMTEQPACCTPMTPLQEVARKMVTHDCGEIPVVQNEQTMKPLGVITDRDITCRALAEGKDPQTMTAKDCMSSPVVTVTEEASVDESLALMEEKRIRRLVVVDSNGACSGIVAQADLALACPPGDAGHLLRQLSEPVRVSFNAWRH